jgi:hypothetical protein
MRLRLFAFVPPAAMISAALLVSASSMVSALEARFTPTASSAIPIQRYESFCEGLQRRIEVLSRAATNCDQDIQCLGSPILCPIAMDRDMQREYRELLEERREQCGTGAVSELVAMSPGIASLMDLSTSPFDVDPSTCHATQTWLESAANREASDTSVFVF